jgi:ubiquinone/menaquinone biosynthesis C-methylase UbiE
MDEDERKVRPRGEIEDGYIDRLAENWPGPREQLHFGGWEATYQLVERLDLPNAKRVMDICCGEGSTACWLADTYDVKVVGIDILEKAIVVARTRAKVKELVDLVTFKRADVFELPFDDSSFDAIYGQDPDGLAHKDRVDAFAECFRILLPGGRFGFQHWLPHSGTPDDILKRFEKTTQGTDYPYMGRLSVDDYVMDLKKAGFINITVEDTSEMYESHTRGMLDVAEKNGRGLDEWHTMLLELYDQGVKVGVRILAEKPK